VGDSVGGSHISTITLIQALDKELYKPIIVLHELGPLSEFLRNKGMDFVLLPLHAYAGSNPSIFSIIKNALTSKAAILCFCSQHKITLVHGNDLRINLTWSLALFATQIKFVWHQRSIPKSASILWRLVPFIASHVISISKAVGQYFNANKNSCSSVIINPVTIQYCHPFRKNEFRIALLNELSIPDNSIVLCFVGRLVPWKKADIFINAFSKIFEKNKQHSLYGILVGADQGGLRADLEQSAVDLGVRDRLFFLGFKENIDMYIGGSDMLVAPSYPEPFGRTLVEAMLLQTPVVASNGAGHREIIESDINGLLVTPDDIEEFVTAIHTLMFDENCRRRITQNAKEIALKRFSVDAHVAEVEKIYRRVLSKNK